MQHHHGTVAAAISSIGILMALQYLHHKKTSKSTATTNTAADLQNKLLIPKLERTESGRVGRLERFSHYVARQIGFDDPNDCPILCKMANDYLRRAEDCETNIYDFSATDEEAETLYVKLIEEFERCILAYFAFHWSPSSQTITHVLDNGNSYKKTNFKDMVLAATRMQRFEKVTKDLKVTRVFSTLVEEIKAIGGVPSSNGSGNVDSKCTEVMVPVEHSQRSPVLLFMGGGMGAGKSTVLKDILKEPFWSRAAGNAVVVEADAFKETDVIYRALSAKGHHGDMLQTAELVHQSSTDAAQSLLVTALNEGRDVIMDGTLSWIPFVEQTIEMARNVHRQRYRMGIGYKVADDSTVTENYWEKVNEDDDDDNNDNHNHGGEIKAATAGSSPRKPYRIELVGVVCDAYLAVVRGMRRAIMVGRAVRVKSQLNSHKNFAAAFSRYCDLVDNAKLYCTNALCGPPQLIGWKDGANKLLVDPEEIQILDELRSIVTDAQSIYELHEDPSVVTRPGSTWKEWVLQPSRPNIQFELKTAIKKYEAFPLQSQDSN